MESDGRHRIPPHRDGGGINPDCSNDQFFLVSLAGRRERSSPDFDARSAVSAAGIRQSSPYEPQELSRLQANADAGDAKAQTALGKAYQEGHGVPQNDALAAKWFRKAAEQGDADGENKLGNMYRTGEGVERDKEEAARWYRKAAKQGNANAMFNLGTCYYNGDGVAIDDLTSYAWFLLAGEAGNPAADEALQRAAAEKTVASSAAFIKVAQLYETGDVLPKNSVEALKWYRKAADAGDPQADVKVASLLLVSGRNPTEEEYAEARRRCEDAANRRSSLGAHCVASMYERGIGVTKDPFEGVKWLGRAAELGYAPAALNLGQAYWKGLGVKPDPVTAYMWIWLAANSKVPGAEQEEQEPQRTAAEKSESSQGKSHRVGY